MLRGDVGDEDVERLLHLLGHWTDQPVASERVDLREEVAVLDALLP